mgnify:CR=1 FL=1
MHGVFKICICFIGFTMFAQDLPKNQVGIWHDNDFFTLTDRYYSFGLGYHYTRRLTKGFFENASEQLRFDLYQKAYTPANLRATSLLNMDRRYAGFLGFETTYSLATKDLFEINVLLGLIGPNSGAGGLQRWYHENIVRYVVPTWAEEMPNAFHSNVSIAYKTQWELLPKPFGIWLVPTPSFTYGTKDIYAQLGGEIFFGRKSSLNQSMAYNQLGDMEKEIYFSIHWNYRWVSRNVLLEHDIPSFQQSPNSHMKLVSYKLYHRFRKNEYRFGYHFMSSEAEGLGNTKVISVGYARSF